MVRNPVMTTRELASYIKLNEKTVIRMAQDGKIPGVKIGNQWRFHLETIDRYLQSDLMDSSDRDLDLIISTRDEIIPLSRLTASEFIKIDSKAGTSKEVLDELVQIASNGNLIHDKNTLIKELKKREKMLSTAVGNGVAFPHPRNPSSEIFREPKIVIVCLKNGIQWHAPDNKPVSIFFMPCALNEFVHVRLLARISRLLHAKGVVEQILAAGSNEDIMRILMEFDKRYLMLIKGRIE
ncbi:MAG: PTS sugar transporter subunit IIA [Candidatus Omnitrophica bacterium]|nr:PTS sugar transporter subunit IIA [Candidatus Omnitrophota bacterium]MDD5081089.1 PTS sugar transporter subunit IIA [Candidatus Omnitrophota bacterium]